MNEVIKNRVLATITKYKTEILEFTKDLIAVATENPPGTLYKTCVEIITKKLSEIGLDCEIIEVPNQSSASKTEIFPRYCILSFYGSGERTLYFHGHYDVVPASNEAQFQPYIENGKLYGRGSSDMKSGLTVMIYALRIIKELKIPFNGRIGLIIVPDEETGGLMGSKYLSDNDILSKSAIGTLLPEPTSGVIWNANRGAISLRITVKGKPAHVALQYHGVNAFERMIAVANNLIELKTEVESRTTSYNIRPEPAKHSILMLGGQCKGGSHFNLVPEEISFTIDRRINPEEDLESEKQRLLGLLEEIKKEGINLNFEILQEGESSGTSEDTPLARALVKNIKTITGNYPCFELCPGLLETRFYTKKGIPALAYGPGLLAVSHGPNEFIRIEDIYKSIAIYALTAIEVFQANMNTDMNLE
ncbi:MAG: M20 family metallopeptidase [Candidatus Hodarchaeota archaeon]